MKIGIVGSWLTAYMGASKPALELARELADCGHEVVVLTTKLGPRGASRHAQLSKDRGGDDVKILRVSDSLIRDISLGKKESIDTIRDVVNGVDILHGTDFPTLLSIVRHYHYRMPIPTVYTLAGKLKLQPRDLIDSGLPSLLNITNRAFLFRALCTNGMIRRIFGSFDRIISTTDFMARALYDIKVPRERVEVIPVAVRIPEPFSGYAAEHGKSPPHRFLYFGAGSSIRGLPDVIDAFNLVLERDPEAILTLCLRTIHGIEKRMYTSRIQRGKMSNSVILKGFEPNMAQIIRPVDAVVLPFRSSIIYSFYPLTILESMALGKPVISTRVGCIPEGIRDGETGFLVPPRDRGAIANKMLLTYDEESMKVLGGRAREYVKMVHDVQIVARRHIDLYEQVIEEFVPPHMR